MKIFDKQHERSTNQKLMFVKISRHCLFVDNNHLKLKEILADSQNERMKSSKIAWFLFIDRIFSNYLETWNFRWQQHSPDFFTGVDARDVSVCPGCPGLPRLKIAKKWKKYHIFKEFFRFRVQLQNHKNKILACPGSITLPRHVPDGD